jgi:glycerol-3-phosphate dehydrogenase (NAD(P)+)
MATAAAVLGAGSWGTALAKLLADQGVETRLWARRRELCEAIQERRENPEYLPGASLPERLRATHELDQALSGVDLVLLVVPSHGVRDLMRRAASHLPEDVPVVAAVKGIENESLALVSEILEQELPAPRHPQLAFLGGPSFAKEVARGVPTAVSVGARRHETAVRVQQDLNTERFRVYTTDDVVGIELGGALKNVVAIAAGIADGLGFGHNTRAALITRGLAEIGRLAIARGADAMTLAGLGGMGDLVLTCTGDLSRNRSVGLELGRGKTLQEVLGGMNMVAEGVKTARSVYELAEREGVDMPIATEVYRVLYEDKSPMEAVVSLMTRPLKAERH